MTTYYLNGNLIPEGSEITLNGFTYPYSWLEGTTQYVRSSHGIEKLGDINYNTKFYWDKNIPKSLDDIEVLDENGDPVYVSVWDPTVDNGEGKDPGAMVLTDKRLITDGLKTTCKREIKQQTNSLLKPTDYYIIRNEIENVEIPVSVSEYRASIIAEQERVVPLIESCTDVEELIEIMNSVNWPRAQ